MLRRNVECPDDLTNICKNDGASHDDDTVAAASADLDDDDDDEYVFPCV